VLVPRERLTDAVAEREAAGWRLAGTWATEALRIEAWRPRLAHDVDHRSIPHELDWLRTAVHLHKGCYRGQETVARVHNLGRPPRRLTMLHLDGSQHLVPDAGAEVRQGGPEGRVVGTMTSVARHHELGPVALAVLKRSVPEDVELTVVGTVGTDAQELAVAASQEVVVPGDGVSADRPEVRREVMRGLSPRGGDSSQSLL
jgi:folate-binding protein YgfZ